MSLQNDNLHIALVHDWILGISGAERVLHVLHELFPKAPIYTLFYNPKFTASFLSDADIRPTFLQKPYNFFRSGRLLTPLMPIAVESLDLGDFDLVISSSVSFSKGLILKPQTKHICYCYSPTRQLWDWHSEYRQEKYKVPKFIIILWQHFFRVWDRHASARIDHFIAISKTVKRRIEKYYHTTSTVIYPPFTKTLTANSKPPVTDYFLIVSRLFKNKNIDVAVEAFNKLGWPLAVVGTGPECKRLKRIAGRSIYFAGYQPDEIVATYYENCLGFIMPQEEDFGITPIEAFSYGKPVLALRRGGALEYVEEGINGEFFEDPIPEVLAYAVKQMKDKLSSYNPEKIKKTAERFSEERFKQEILEFTEGI